MPMMDRLRIIPYDEHKGKIDFSCGDEPHEKELNDFINTQEVMDYARSNYGKTSLVFMDSQLIAYFTIASADIRDEWVQDHVNRPKERLVHRIPAWLIGRLAVQREYRRQGIGSHLLKVIVGKALEVRKFVAIRLVILTAYPENIDWYGKRGFQMCVKDHLHITKTEYRKKPFLYLDLNQLDGTG
jgi:GNAT superfamily N-acetyltransferase